MQTLFFLANHLLKIKHTYIKCGTQWPLLHCQQHRSWKTVIWKLEILTEKKPVYILTQAETGVTVSCKYPSKQYEYQTCQIFVDPKTKPKPQALQCPPSACHARHQPYRLRKPPSNLPKKFTLTSNSWQTDPCLTLTRKHTDTQAVTCLQHVLKFLHYLNYGEKLMMGHTIWATRTYKRGQAEDGRASSKGSDCCSAPGTQHAQLSDTTRIAVLFTQVTLMWKDAIFSHLLFL